MWHLPRPTFSTSWFIVSNVALYVDDRLNSCEHRLSDDTNTTLNRDEAGSFPYRDADFNNSCIEYPTFYRFLGFQIINFFEIFPPLNSPLRHKVKWTIGPALSHLSGWCIYLTACLLWADKIKKCRSLGYLCTKCVWVEMTANVSEVTWSQKSLCTGWIKSVFYNLSVAIPK